MFALFFFPLSLSPFFSSHTPNKTKKSVQQEHIWPKKCNKHKSTFGQMYFHFVDILKIILCILSLTQSHINVENKNALSGVYSNACSNNMKLSEHLVAFSPRSYSGNDTNLREVIVSTLSEHTVPFGINMLASLVHIGNLGEVEKVEFVFIIFDDVTMDICDDMYIPCWIPRNSLALKNHTVVNRFRFRQLVVPDVTERLLDVGAHVLYSDTDTVWLRSPYDLLHSNSASSAIQVGICL